MQETEMVLPVLPGKQESLIALANSLMNERKAEYIESQQTVTKESWFLQPTPMGDLCIVYFVSVDPGVVFKGLAESQEPFDVWFRSQVLDCTGFDLTQLPSGLPPRIFNWER